MSEQNELTLEEREALTAMCEKRALTYGFLARLYFKEVDEAELKKLKGMGFPLHTGSQAADRGYWMLTHYLSNTWENSLEELARDYTKAFIGAGTDGFSAAHPFESVYRSKECLLMTDARDEVLALYRSEGLEKDSSWKEGEDHLALEFEFMQTLARRTIEALQNDDLDLAANLLETQRNFLNDHISQWVFLFTADVKRFALTEFYQGLALITEGFVETDKEFLDALVEDDVS